MEMPDRAPVVPATNTRPPRSVAPADEPPLPFTEIEPDIRFSPTLQPHDPLTVIVAPSHMPPQNQPTGPSKITWIGCMIATARLCRAAGLVSRISGTPSAAARLIAWLIS